MKTLTLVFVAALSALPVMAQSGPSASEPLDTILRHSMEVQDTIVSAGTRNLEARDYAIANETIRGCEKQMREFVEARFTRALSNDLAGAYESNSTRSLDTKMVGSIPVLALTEFETGTLSYDWERLHAKYPNVKAVIRVSTPAVASDAFAVARYEVITPNGPEWSAHELFEKRGDGQWHMTEGQVGDIWEKRTPAPRVPEPIGAEAAVRR
jgi:hypothetical protein